MALVQGSDIFDGLTGPSQGYPKDVTQAIRRWSAESRALRLGYWKEHVTGTVVHGIRFLTLPERPARSLHPDGIKKLPWNANQIWISVLGDVYLFIISGLGVAALAAAIFAWIKFPMGKPPSLTPPLPTPTPTNTNSLIGNYIDTITGASPIVLLRGIIFTLLPSLVFGLFNNFFISADLYRRTVKPVENMTRPLPDADRKRCMRDSELHEGSEVAGATAQDSMLLDFVSANIITCVSTALVAGHWRLAYGAVLATVCNSVYIVVGRIFVFDESVPSIRLSVSVQPSTFYAAFAILVVYCVSIWVLRPRGVVRTCRSIFTLMDFVCLVHQSLLRQCPEFWLQGLHVGDTEDHMKGQVVLANRVYRFGIYRGMDNDEYVGISIHSVPKTWGTQQGDDSIPILERSVDVARRSLQLGLYNERVYLSEALLGDTSQFENKIRSNDYRSWRRRISGKQKRSADERDSDA